MANPYSNELNQEAAVVGWVSSTDVMLLCVVLLMAATLTVQSGWNRSASALDTVSKENTSLAQELEQLKKIKNRDVETWDALHKKLADSDAMVLSARKELSELQTALKQAVAEQATLVTAAAASEKLVEQLRDRVMDQESVSQLRKEELGTMVVQLEQQVTALKLAHARVADHATVVKELSEAKERLKRGYAAYEKLYSSWKNAEQDRGVIRASFEEYRAHVTAEAANSRIVKRELVGLQGDLRRVGIVFDPSVP